MTGAARAIPWLGALLLAAALTGCETTRAVVTAPPPSPPAPRPSTPPASRPPVPDEAGPASWYGRKHQGQPTASGEAYDMYALTAAHPSLPLGTRVRVTNLTNGRSVEVRVNDRGPIVPDRIIDLSYQAAKILDAVSPGVVPVKVRVLALPPSP